jgi:hypothetical protein
MCDAERLAHRHRHNEAARLERAGRQPALVLHDDRRRRVFFASFGGRISGVVTSPG